MELYYHVTHINKKKECRFNFYFIRGSKRYIHGSAIVNMKTPERMYLFDESSNYTLEEDEKRYIVTCVLKHV